MLGFLAQSKQKAQRFSQDSRSIFYNPDFHVTLEFKKARKDVSILVSSFPIFLLPSLNVPEYFLRYQAPTHDVKMDGKLVHHLCSHEYNFPQEIICTTPNKMPYGESL